ncbi:MAG: glycoside hydrolase family protein [Oscillospiraceae bacterium]
MKKWLCVLLAAVMLLPTAAYAAEGRRTSWEPSDAIVEFIANQEGFRATPHQSGGYWYVGFGTQVKAGQYAGGISREEAKALLMEDIDAYARSLNAYLTKYGIAVTQNQYDALLSFTHNLGTTWMKTSYTLSKYLINGAEKYTDLQIVNAFGSWCRAGGQVLPGLARRRIEEAKIFLYGDYGLFNYNYYYTSEATAEKEEQLTALLTEMEELEAQRMDGQGDEAALTERIDALSAEIEALEEEIEAEGGGKPDGPAYPDGKAVDFTYVRFDPGKGAAETTLLYYVKGQPYGEFPTARRSGYRLLAWETEDGKRLLPTDCPTGAKAVKAVWTTGKADNRYLSLSPFSDVSIYDWYYDELKEMYDGGVIGGYADGYFRPGDAVSCGAALKLVLLAAGYPEQPAAGGSAFGGYQALALKEGLAEESEIADLKAPASRLLVARLAARALGLSAAEGASPYADTDDPWAAALYDTGVMVGMVKDGRQVLNADAGIRRCEMAAVIWRMAHYEPAEETVSSK